MNCCMELILTKKKSIYYHSSYLVNFWQVFHEEDNNPCKIHINQCMRVVGLSVIHGKFMLITLALVWLRRDSFFGS